MRVILALGLTLTSYYIRTRRLWPAIVTHGLFDSIGLTARLHQH